MIRLRHPGGFWRRVGALAIDWLWLFCAVGGVSIVLFGDPFPSADDGGARAIATWTLHNLVPPVAIVLSWRLLGGSPGKLLLDLRIVDARGAGRPGLGRLTLRFVGYFVSALPLGLGFIWALFNHDRRTFHDLLSGTRVVVVDEIEDPDPVLGAPA